MNTLPEIPRYIRYDFFMALLGLFVAYFLFTNEKVYSDSLLRALFTVISASALLYGLLEMKSNYGKDKIILDLERQYNKDRLLSLLKKN